jgi:hypothetical protein
MRKPETPDEARIGAKRKSRANEQRGLKERLQVIKEYINDRRDVLKRFRKKLH